MRSPERALFDIPENLAYFNCAYLSPLLNEAVAIGREALLRKARPWTIVYRDFFDEVETLRACFAGLIEAAPGDIAITASSAYGIATAAANIPFGAGDNLVVPDTEHASTYHKWRVEATARGAELRICPPPGEGAGWADAILSLIDGRTRVVSVPHVHWGDGGLFDLDRIGRRAREVGAQFVIDGTQSIGALPLSVKRLDPDWLVCSAYKWLFCPYGFAFLYAAPRNQGGRPLEEHFFHRRGVAGHEGRLDHLEAYDDGARRFDMAERSNFIILPMAIAALRWLAACTVPEINRRIGLVADQITAGAEPLGWYAAPPDRRSPHLFGLRRRGGLPADLGQRLQAANVWVSIRGDAIRLSPHLYNDPVDVARLLDALPPAER